MPGLKRFSLIVSVLLALVLVWAPVLPSLAMTAKADDAHAAHAGDHGDHGGAVDAGMSKQSPCTQHDACNGQCCDICAQCFSAVAPVSLEQVRPHPVQTPALTRMHSRIFAASHDRPPRFLSL